MIKKLRRKVVLLTMTSLSVLLALVVTAMNVINYGFIVENADDVLTYVNQNDGRFPDKHKEKITPTDALVKPPVNKRINDETEYESRFFSVVLTEGGGVVLVDTGKIAAVNSDGAVAMAREALSGGRARGFSGIYRYAVMRCADGLVRVTFLDSRHGLENFRYFLNVSVGLTLTALAIALVVVFFLAGRFIRPIAESYEKQKRFITDAGHEIKTPLTVINANAELLECDFGENESIEDIKDQTKRLTALTEKLVYLARMEENDKSLPKETFSLTGLAEEMAPPADLPAAGQRGKICLPRRRDHSGADKAGAAHSVQRQQPHGGQREKRRPGAPVRAVLPGGRLPQFRDRRPRHRPFHGKGHHGAARRQDQSGPDRRRPVHHHRHAAGVTGVGLRPTVVSCK